MLSKLFTDFVLNIMTDEQLLEIISQIVPRNLNLLMIHRFNIPKLLTRVLGRHSKGLTSLKCTVLDKTLNVAIKFFDEGIVMYHKKIEHIEDRLSLSSK